MKALTLCQPYAHLIAIGEKRVENRTWETLYRGPLAIHAGKSRTWLLRGDVERYPDMAFGAIVAVARLIHCIPLPRIRLGRLPPDLHWVREHQHAEGPWCWVLADVHRLDEPIPLSGRPRLFNLPDDIAQRVMTGAAGASSVPATPEDGHSSDLLHAGHIRSA